MLQNALLRLNPNMDVEANWKPLKDNNIQSFENTTEGGLVFCKVNIIDSAALSMKQVADKITEILEERGELRNLAQQLNASENVPDTVNALIQYLMDDTFFYSMGDFLQHLGTSTTSRF